MCSSNAIFVFVWQNSQSFVYPNIKRLKNVSIKMINIWNKVLCGTETDNTILFVYLKVMSSHRHFIIKNCQNSRLKQSFLMKCYFYIPQ